MRVIQSRQVAAANVALKAARERTGDFQKVFTTLNRACGTDLSKADDLVGYFKAVYTEGTKQGKVDVAVNHIARVTNVWVQAKLGSATLAGHESAEGKQHMSDVMGVAAGLGHPLSFHEDDRLMAVGCWAQGAAYYYERDFHEARECVSDAAKALADKQDGLSKGLGKWLNKLRSLCQTGEAKAAKTKSA